MQIAATFDCPPIRSPQAAERKGFTELLHVSSSEKRRRAIQKRLTEQELTSVHPLHDDPVPSYGPRSCNARFSPYGISAFFLTFPAKSLVGDNAESVSEEA